MNISVFRGQFMAKRVSVINFKGGVGKTVLAFHLGAGLARYHDAKVLMIDVDHQSSLSIVCLGSRRVEQGCRWRPDHRRGFSSPDRRQGYAWPGYYPGKPYSWMRVLEWATLRSAEPFLH